MDSNDPARKELRNRNGERVFKVPLNGSQKIEIKNVSKEEVSLECNIHSHRFSCLNSLIAHRPGYCGFEVRLPPGNSIVIVIKDNGHVELDPRDRPSFLYEGVFRYFAKEYSQYILLRTDPDTESYRKLRDSIDDQADCDIGLFEDDKIDEFISIEPISDDKYGTILPNNVKMLKLDADGERHNAVMRKEYALNHVPEFNPFMDGSQYDRRCEILKEYDERLRKEQQKIKKTQLVYATPESKRSVKSEKSDAKSWSENPTSAVSQSKRSVKSEKFMNQDPKSAMKSEKSTKSEMVQNSEKVDVPELKNQEKKKKKKKKRCAIC